MKIFSCFIIGISIILFLIFYFNFLKRILDLFKNFFSFIISIFKSRFIIYQLTKRDFINKYLGSFLGLTWAFIQPVAYIIVIWAVFTFGLKTTLINNNIPYMLWLVVGLIPWFFISESINSSTSSIIEYSYLIKKVVFRASIIPIIKILSVLIIHLVLLFLIIFFCIFYKFYPKIIWIQIIYYLFSAIILITGLSWLTSSLTVFIRDIGQIVLLVTQIMFWLTPIFWDYNLIPKHLKIIFYLNPFHYIIQGYRNTFIFNIWFWEAPDFAFSFWIITILLFFAGAIIFKKLRPHFADVL
ncbi:MAG: ABC transporter permease [Spirochaetes bacterium]|nr:ABC transporter permease [Spirochaetota bacterium]